MAAHSSTLAWRIPWTKEPGGLQSIGSPRVRHEWATSFSLSCIGEGNGNPLQCSCLEDPRDGEAWWAAIYGVTQSRTRLKWLSSMPSKVLDVLFKKGWNFCQEQQHHVLLNIDILFYVAQTLITFWEIHLRLWSPTIPLPPAPGHLKQFRLHPTGSRRKVGRCGGLWGTSTTQPHLHWAWVSLLQTLPCRLSFTRTPAGTMPYPCAIILPHPQPRMKTKILFPLLG